MSVTEPVAQAWITGVQTVEVREARLTLGDADALVGAARAGICGSDVHTYRAGHPWLDLPVGPGHEAVGVVEALGPAVEDLRVGDRVVLQPAVFCGECRLCRQGRENMCERLIAYGAHEPGGAAEAFVVPASSLRKLPDQLELSTASLIEPVACVAHALDRAGDVEGRAVAVLGSGTIGLCLTALAAARGAGRLVATDRRQSKLDVAKHLGADEGVIGVSADAVDVALEALGGPADVVFDCAATEATIQQSLALAGRGSDIVVVGCRGPRAEVDWHALQDAEQSLIATQMFTEKSFAEAIAFVAQEGPRLAPMITATYPVREAAAAFRAAASGTEIKVQVAG